MPDRVEMAQQRSTSPGFRDERYRLIIEKLVQRRKELGLTQQILADRLGLHKQFVSRVELGERRLDVVEFIDYARALSLDPSALASLIEPSI